MSKVIYFTNAVNPDTFKEYLSEWKVSPNLSNQNFHAKMIKAISLYDHVEVISVRPINKNYARKSLPRLETSEVNIDWKYPKVSVSRIAKYLFLNKRIDDVLSLDKEKRVVLVDALNLSLLKAAVKVAKRNKYKVFGVCTDNPYNISFVSKSYTDKLIKLARSLDGYIVLTDAINKLFNINNKPSIVIDGVNEDIDSINPSSISGKYIYFGGSLMEEYGLYDLIDAFKALELKDIKLVICGHHLRNSLFTKINNDPNIIYLGAVSYEDNLSLQKGAMLSINPRPINPLIDDYSMPSKTLECLASSVLNITVDNKLLKKHYDDVIIWAKSSKADDLKEAINKALSLSDKEKGDYIKRGKEKVMERTSLEVIGKKVHDLII